MSSSPVKKCVNGRPGRAKEKKKRQKCVLLEGGGSLFVILS